MATPNDADIQGLIEKMHELLHELERACIASRVAWKSFLRLQEDLRTSSALRPVRRGLYHEHARQPH